MQSTQSISVHFLAVTCLLLRLGPTMAAADEAGAKKPTKQELQFFESRVRPILVEACYACHSLDANLAEGGLRLDSSEAMHRGGSGGPVIVSGNPGASMLIRAIEHRDPNLQMPPKDAGGKLTDAQIKDLTRWVRMGAPDPREEASHVRAQEAVPDSAKHWWAFQPMTRPAVPNPLPAESSSDWAWNSIDAFVLSKHRAEGVAPAPDAAPETLLRRLTFDLIGLPPTAEQQEAFQKLIATRSRQDAIGAIVDQLLESENFGAHWGRHWLDVARYAESTGREVNLPFNQAWRYRDWVIDAFQNNQPFDQFLIDQIAGDLLESDGASQHAHRTIATGFLAIGSRNVNEGNPMQFAVDQADEQIDTLFQATMATTFACARCHDHKFDPISQSQYTAVTGIFLSTDTRFGIFGGNKARNGAPAIELPASSGVVLLNPPWNEEQIASKRAELTELRERIETMTREQKEARKDQKKAVSIDRSQQQELRKLNEKASEIEFHLSAVDTSSGQAKGLAMGVQDKPIAEVESDADRKRKDRDKNAKRRGAFTHIGDSPFYARGDIGMPGAKVPRSVPNLFGVAEQYAIPNTSSGRLQLARWIASPSNPLTARVAVNRFWHWLIGQGIVDTVDNFGTTGSLPSHPELLDHLATQFIDNGWNIKKLIRDIATSRTYQLASVAPADSTAFDLAFTMDPENRWCWRGKRRRLQAEEIRDTMLIVAGRLDPSRPLGTTMAKHFGSRVDVGIGRKRSKGEVLVDDICRSVYLPLPRSAAPEMLELFDLPDGTFVQGVREATNVPLQSLYLLNNQTVAGYAGTAVRSVIERFPGRGNARFEERLAALYELIMAREPTSDEMLLADQLLKESDSNEAGWISLVRGLLATAEFRYLD